MPSYVITGASKGLGVGSANDQTTAGIPIANSSKQWAFLEKISGNSSNNVIGIVRDKAATDKRVKEELGGRSNITILQADITDYAALKVSLTY